MDGWLKLLIAGACIVVIAGGGYYAMGEYNRAEMARDRDAARQRTATAERVEQLASGGCREQIGELLKKHSTNAITSPSDVDGRLRTDVSLCLRYDLAYAFEKNEMKRAGLDEVFR